MDKLFKLVLNDSQTVLLNESQLRSIYPNFEASTEVSETPAKSDVADELLSSNNAIPVLRQNQVSSPSLPPISAPSASPLASGPTSLLFELDSENLKLVGGKKPLKAEGKTPNPSLGTAMTSEIPTGMLTSIQGTQEVAHKENLSLKNTDRGTSRSIVISSTRKSVDSPNVHGSTNSDEDDLVVPYITNVYIITSDGIKRGLTYPENIQSHKIPSLMRQFLDEIGLRSERIHEAAVVSDSMTMIPVAKKSNMAKDATENVEVGDSKEDKAPPRISVDGVLTVCHSCDHMMDSRETRCSSCSKKIPGEVKEIINERYNNGSSRNLRSLRGGHRERVEEQRKKKTPKKSQELVCLSLISSDEDEQESSPKADISQESIDSSLRLKEPVITDDTESPNPQEISSSMIGGGIVDYSDVLDSPDVESAQVHCRSVRFGSYKVNSIGKVKITHFGFKLTVPPVNGPEDEAVTVTILKHDIVKVLANFGRQTPVIFYYTTSRAGAKVRNALKMSLKPEAVYFDPTSTVEMHRRITLFPEKIPTETRLFLKSIYNQQLILEELTSEEADRILVRAKPKEVLAPPEKDPLVAASVAARSVPIQRIMTYPPAPLKGGIPINTEDYACLDEDQFLNDVIIDFYLKWYVANKLKPEDQKRTYVFSSFFYKRLTTSAGKHAEDTKLSPAERRHKRVKSWTKSVDLFSKDFIIIPINENSHWFLGIICFPGLTEAVRMSDNTPVSNPSRRLTKGDDSMSGKVGSSVTITKTTVPSEKQPTITTTINLEGEDGEKDEAEGDDDDLEPNTSDEESTLPSGYEDGELLDDVTPPTPKTRSRPKQTDTDHEPIKQPCILIFDSLAGAMSSRSRVCATLREYLQVEYNSKNKGGKPREINKFNFRAAIPKVPQQTNFTDCGLYVLQYVEAFFQNPISDYRMPIKELKEWFCTDIVGRKRYQIQQLLHQLMAEQNVDMSTIKLPKLNLRPEGSYSDEEEEMDMYDEDMGEEEEEEEEEMCEEEEDEDGDLPPMLPPTATISVAVPPSTVSPIMSSPSVSFTQIPAAVAVVSSTNAATFVQPPSPVPPPSTQTAPNVVVVSSSSPLTVSSASTGVSAPISTVISTDELRATLVSRGILTKSSLAPSSPTSSNNAASVTVSRPMPPQFAKGEVTFNKRKINTGALKDVRSPRLSSASETEIKKKRVE